jgi:hypothetical protein
MPKAPGEGRVGRAKDLDKVRGNPEDLPEEGRAGKVSSVLPVVDLPADSKVVLAAAPEGAALLA